jgi:hypothetical protein
LEDELENSSIRSYELVSRMNEETIPKKGSNMKIKGRHP